MATATLAVRGVPAAPPTRHDDDDDDDNNCDRRSSRETIDNCGTLEDSSTSLCVTFRWSAKGYLRPPTWLQRRLVAFGRAATPLAADDDRALPAAQPNAEFDAVATAISPDALDVSAAGAGSHDSKCVSCPELADSTAAGPGAAAGGGRAPADETRRPIDQPAPRRRCELRQRRRRR